MAVFVIGLTEKRLMPTTERKARILLKQKKAEVFCKNPFTIKLLYQTGGTTQHVTLGVDTGSQHLGFAVAGDNGNIIHEQEVSLRRSMEKRKLLVKCKESRRGRRYRKVRYRHPKWRHHTVRAYIQKGCRKKGAKRYWKKLKVQFSSPRPEGWLPPSLQSKTDHHIRWIHRFLDVLPKNARMVLEVGRFDAARMKNPEIHGELYQRGPQYDYENVKAYVFDRDSYKCRCCHAKAGTRRKDGTVVKLIAHHIDYRSRGASDNPDALASVCDACHTAVNHQPGGVLYDWMIKNKRFKRGHRDTTFMNILRRRLFEAFPDAEYTYGNITAARRKELMLPKSHADDAVAIACTGMDINSIRKRPDHVVYVQQVRKKKRSLHEANPRKWNKTKNHFAVRNSKNTKEVNGVCLFDKVEVPGKGYGWVTGFTGTSCYVLDRNGNYVTTADTYKQVAISRLKVIQHSGNWISGLKCPIGNGS